MINTKLLEDKKSISIEVNALSKAFNSTQVLKNLSFSVPAGESLSIIGRSGCGKSTLLYLLAGLLQADTGSIVLGATADTGDLAKPPRTSIVLQDYGLFPWKTVAENIILPLKLRKEPASFCKEALQEMLTELDLQGLAKRYPAELSGGQRQRVALGRALIEKPDLLFLDEPFSSVDAITREHLQNLVLELWARYKFTYVLVTHSVPEAVFLGKNIMVLKGSPAQKGAYLENPYFGDANCRKDEKYFNLTCQVQTELAKSFE